ncbi:MAG: FAD-binding oxidoreductase, partial [Dehalococcoidia bacterium]
MGEALITEGAAFAVEGLTPQFVATPASSEELAAVLQVAAALEAAVIPWGGGQHMVLGNTPARYDVALRTSSLDRVLEYEPTDMTITIEAGITFKHLQAVLREHSQFLPIDAPPEATVGGALAVGISGPSRHAYGLPRDWLIGCRVAHVDGSVSKGGGRVVKNVAGYDMPKLAVGSLGTLGVTIEATFKVAPLPVTQETLVAAFPSFESASSAVMSVQERDLALRAIVLADTLEQGSPEALAGFWLAGSDAAVDRTRQELNAAVQGASHTWWMT